MRYFVMAGVAVVLAGCGPGQFFSPERIAERQEANHINEMRKAQQRSAYEASPEGKAHLGCSFRTNAAMSGWRARDILDLEGAVRSNQLHAQCLDYWRRTGQLP